MSIYSNIMVPVVFDHAEKAEHAYQVAKSIKAEGGKITLLHVLEEMPGYIMSQLPSGVKQDTLNEADRQLQNMAQRFGNDVNTIVAEGHASRTILDKAEELGTDCIVIASHKPGLGDYLLGSTAARVVRHGKCCVHVLR